MAEKVLAAERRQRLARQLVEDGGVKVGQTARLFGVSTETIRKDLIYLEEQGIARKSHGGAIPAGELLERSSAVKGTENPEAKAEIAIAARELIPDGAIIIIDAGTTTYELALLVAQMNGVTVFTNSVPILSLLGPTDNAVLGFGGQVRRSSMAVAGGWAIDALRSIHVDLAFLGTDGFDGVAGPSCLSYEETQFKVEVIRASTRSVVLADHSKFRQPALFQYATWDEISTVVTDHRIRPEDTMEIGRHTQIITAGPDRASRSGSDPITG